MVKCCSAIGCASRCLPNSKLKGLTFHVFPTDENVKRKWVLAMKRLDVNAAGIWEPKKGDVLCSRHFKKTDFDRSAPNIKLKPGVIPSIFDSPSHFQSHGTHKRITKILRHTKKYIFCRSDKKSRYNFDPFTPDDYCYVGFCHFFDNLREKRAAPPTKQGKREKLHCRKNFTLKTLPVTNHSRQLVGASARIEEFRSQFVFEHSYSVMDSPKKLKHKLDHVISELEDTKKSLRNVLDREKRFQKSLRKTIRELKDECLISQDTANRLEAFCWDHCQESIQRDYNS